MRRCSARRALAALALAALAALGSAQQRVADLSLEPDPGRYVGLDQRLGAELPSELAFRDESGREVRLAEIGGGKPIVLALVYYTCPRLCTEVLNGAVRCLRDMPLAMGRDYHFVAVSIDPTETPALAATKKRGYLEELGERGASEGWHFLTGDAASIEELAASVGYRFVYDERAAQYAHPSGLVVVTPDGRLAHYLYGFTYSAEDLRQALVAASEGRVGGLVQKILLLCFHYDPTTGKYGFAIFGVIRALGLGTVALIAFYVVRMLRRERRAALERPASG